MLAVIVLLGILIFSVVALLIMHFNLRETVEILRSRIDLQNERYEKCLKGWGESNQSVLKVVKLNDTMSKMNRELCDIIDDELDEIHEKVDSMSETLLKVVRPEDSNENEE